MATIRSYPFVRYARVEASSLLVVFRNGRIARSGRGMGVWFLPQGTTSLAEVPVDDRDHVIAVSALTRDFQTVSLQGAATWRAADALKLASRIDFSIDSRSGAFRGDPMTQIAALLDGLIKTVVETFVAERTVAQVIDEGIRPLLIQVESAFATASRLSSIGIELVGVRLSDLTPSPDLVRALRQPTVERLQQAADEATFKRRANAVEKEAEIAENETKAKINLEETRAELIDRERQNELAKARATAEKAKIDADSAADTKAIEAEAQAKARGITASAEASALSTLDEVRLKSERERAEIAKALPPVVVLAEALKDGLAHAKIGSLTLGPDTMAQIGDTFAKAMGQPRKE